MRKTSAILIKSVSSLLAGVLILSTLLATAPVYAESSSKALVSIIIDDLGYKHHQDFRAVDLPAPIVCAILPHTPLSSKVAERAHRAGKEIILHVPMESMHKHKHKNLGPGALYTKMSKQEFLSTLRKNLKSVPLAIGLNNHMGSLLTTHPIQMHWLMDELKQHGYAYIDSMTTSESVANIVARNKKLPYLVRDVFLDNEVNPNYIRGQLERLVQRAKKKGSAIAIGHPHKATLDALENFIREAHYQNIDIVSMTEMLKHRKHNTHTLRTTALPKESDNTFH